jgi:hypothetical protein
MVAEERGNPRAASKDREDAAPGDEQAAEGSSRKGALRRILDFFDSTTKVLLAVGGLVAAAAALWAGVIHFVPSGSGQGDQTTNSSFVVRPESCGALTFGADGNARPVTCPDGRPNLAAVRYFDQSHLSVLSLGAYASPGNVTLAICRDIMSGDTTFPIEASAVQLATAEQDWHFGLNLSQEIPQLAPDCRSILATPGS